MQKNSQKNFILLFLGLSLLLTPLAFAGAQNLGGDNSQPKFQGFTDSPKLQGDNSRFGLQNPLNYKTICGLINGLLKVFLTIGIPIAVLFLVYAGFLFVWARGSVEGLTKAKNNLFYTLLGIALFLGAWFLGQVIASTVNALSPGTVGQTFCT